MKTLHKFIIFLILFIDYSYGADFSIKKIHVAVASNFAVPFKEIARLFVLQYKKPVEIITSCASSGKLYTQILNGAPFDIFFSADYIKPKMLKKKYKVLPNIKVYAFGKLAVWYPKNNKISIKNMLLQKKIKRIALANPNLAPYGMAAKETLVNLKIWDKFFSSKKIILADNINHTFNLIKTNAIQVGFISLSQYLLEQKKNNSLNHQIWVVPQKLYSPIEQTATMTVKGMDNQEALDLYKFISTNQFKAIIKNHGYETLYGD